jgi:pimeloyl-ACP methyl ester carboxylesterase
MKSAVRRRRELTHAVAIMLLSAGTLATAAKPCVDLSGFEAPGRKVDFQPPRQVPASSPGVSPQVPAHCRIDGVIDARTGRDGKRYGIGFALALPESWNGRFLFQGGGGLNGSVQPPIGAAYAGEQSALARGFAVASTDSGHQGTGFDASFFADQQAALNFLYQAVPDVTAVAKPIVARHYGKAAGRSYFVGCSTGGREAMMMSQRYPADFDGIVSVAPAIRTNFSNLGLRHATTALNAIAPPGAEGRPDTRAALSEADRRLLIDSVVHACDALDGQRDGLLFAAHQCRFDPGTLTCKESKNESCLTAAQVNAIRTVMQGPRTAAGHQIYPGYYFDTGIATIQGLPGVLAGPVIPEGRPVGVSMDVEAASIEAMNARAMVGDTGAWTNLSTFHGRGGKLIFAHGVSDPWFSAQDTVQYYERLGQDNGGRDVKEWSRLFLVPGMGHCGGGVRTLDRFDMLDAIVGWVEQDRAPDRVIATGASLPGEDRPLCPYPMHAHYTGQGDARSATNYDCRN